MIAPPEKRRTAPPGNCFPAATDALRTGIDHDAGQLSVRRATVVSVFKFFF
jgi:hypothetical protein